MITFTMKTNSDGFTHNDQPLYLAPHNHKASAAEEALHLTPNTNYLVLMVPMPEGYRLLSGGAEPALPKPKGTMHLAPSGFVATDGEVWGSKLVYIVPDVPDQVEVQVLGKKKMISYADAQKMELV